VLATILHDVFEVSEAPALRDALDELCCPTDNYGWASTGVYCFFNPDPNIKAPGRRILYIGRAVDLAERFAQHVGLIHFPANNCKRESIKKWFDGQPRLGFSCCVQSPFDQVNTHRERSRYGSRGSSAIPSRGPLVDNPEYGQEYAVELEGALIEMFRLLHGDWPLWNRVGGDKRGQARVGRGREVWMLPMLDGTQDSLFRSRLSIRELATDTMATQFESNALHVARVMVFPDMPILRPLPGPIPVPTDLDVMQTLVDLARNPFFQGTELPADMQQIKESGYLRRAPGVPGDWW
jgi:hypothetical protein